MDDVREGEERDGLGSQGRCKGSSRGRDEVKLLRRLTLPFVTHSRGVLDLRDGG